ncbi:unnamed protein product, partial [Allacma fusca]
RFLIGGYVVTLEPDATAYTNCAHFFHVPCLFSYAQKFWQQLFQAQEYSDESIQLFCPGFTGGVFCRRQFRYVQNLRFIKLEDFDTDQHWCSGDVPKNSITDSFGWGCDARQRQTSEVAEYRKLAKQRKTEADPAPTTHKKGKKSKLSTTFPSTGNSGSAIKKPDRYPDVYLMLKKMCA